jgi:hypothetical protein
MSDPNINCGSGGDKALHIAQSDFEGLDLAANLGQYTEGGKFGSLQKPGRQEGKMSGELRQIGMQFLAEVLHELPHWTFYVGD